MSDIYQLCDNATDNSNSSDLDYFYSTPLTQDDGFDATNYCHYTNPSPVLHIILAILYTLVCVIGVFGNMLVIFVVIKFR